MKKPTYAETIALVNELTLAHQKEGEYDHSYAAVAGCLTAILGMLVDDSITKYEAVQFLKDAIVKAKSNS